MTPVPELLVAVLQTGPQPVDAPGASPLTGLVASGVGSFLFTLVVGWILITVAPAYTQGRMETLQDQPVGSFLWGLLVLGGLVVISVVLLITVVGALLVVPIALVAVLVWALGAAIAYLAVGDRLVGHEDGWLKPSSSGRPSTAC